jgi:Activator of Hsp90 ATPase homolog 1-like protein
MSENLSWTFQVDESPQRAYEAINDVRGWWSEHITGRTDELGAEFSYWVPGVHYTKFRVTELVPGRRVSWLALESWLAFLEDKEEWTGTTVTFDISEVDERTQVRFTHHGLIPDVECYDVCRVAWGGYITNSLRELITTGTGQPNSIESPEAVERVRPTLASLG